MEAYILRIELTESQVKAVQNEIDKQNAYEKEHRGDGTWTIKDELLYGVRKHVHDLEREAADDQLPAELYHVNPADNQTEELYENRTGIDREPATASGGI